MIKRPLSCLLLALLAFAPLTPAGAQKSAPPFNALAVVALPGADPNAAAPLGVYVGEGLVLTNWHPWTLDGRSYTDETGALPPSRQIPHYDADGQADPEEYMAGQADCMGVWRPLAEAGPACTPFVRSPGASVSVPLAEQGRDRALAVQRLIFASRAHDLAVWEIDPADAAALGVQPARLRAAPVGVGENVLAVLPSPDSGGVSLLPVAVENGAPALLPASEAIRLDGPWRVPSLALSAALPEGAPILDAASAGLLGLAWRVGGSKTAPQTWVTPTSEWINALFEAAETLDTPALGRVLADAHVGPVDAPLTLGDPLTPALGNSGIDVQRYELDLAFDLKARRLSGTAALTVRAAADQLRSFGLDAYRLAVEQVTLGGAPISFVVKEHKLLIELPTPLPYGAEFTVAIRYSAQPQPFTSRFIPFFQIGMFFAENQVSVLDQPDGAHTWFPCNDHPLDRAAYDFRLTAPQPLEAVANGTLLSVEDAGLGARTFHWRMDAPMSTYLATVAIADYEVVEGQTPDGIALAHYVYPGAQAAAETVFGATADAIALLEGYFGPYPYPSYGHVVVPQEGMALETQTLTTMPASVLRGSPTEVYGLLVHELAHQWLGNAVTLDNWADIWLNEGFASYAEWLAREARFGAETAQAARSFSEQMLISDRRVTPLIAPAPDETFGVASYDKGAWVLHMLRRTIGDEAFFRLLRAYAGTFRDRPVDTPAFWRLVEEVSGQDLAWFFDQWLLQAGGLPRYTLYWSETAAGADVLLCARGAGRYRLDLPLAFRRDTRAEVETLAVEGAEVRASFALDFAPAALAADPDQSVLAQVEVQPIAALPEACPAEAG